MLEGTHRMSHRVLTRTGQQVPYVSTARSFQLKTKRWCVPPAPHGAVQSCARFYVAYPVRSWVALRSAQQILFFMPSCAPLTDIPTHTFQHKQLTAFATPLAPPTTLQYQSTPRKCQQIGAVISHPQDSVPRSSLQAKHRALHGEASFQWQE